MKLDTQRFNEWLADGNAFKTTNSKYLEQSTQYTKEFTLTELKQFFIKEYQS